VPRPIDSVAMLPYLLDPNQPSIRTTNFSQIGQNLQVNGAINGPCLIGTSCTQIPVSKSVCEDNNGVWYGAGSDVDGVPAAGFPRCCNVDAFLAGSGQAPVAISPDSAAAIRNDHYKIVQNTTMEYQSQAAPCVNTVETEFYAIAEGVPLPLIDNPDRALPLASLTPEQQQNYDALAPQLAAILAQAPMCPGDGNIDFVVDQKDLDDWSMFAGSGGLSTVYDLNLDGLTNAADQTIIEQNLGRDCSGG
jgi:hypothetical protein